MPQNRRRQPGLELGVILLLSEMFNVGIGTIPKVTFFTILGQANEKPVFYFSTSYNQRKVELRSFTGVPIPPFRCMPPDYCMTYNKRLKYLYVKSNPFVVLNSRRPVSTPTMVSFSSRRIIHHSKEVVMGDDKGITFDIQVLLYLGVINVPWTKWDVCISADLVLKYKDYRRFIFSTFEHADDMHLYYNMVSFLIKGRTLENRYGSSNFALLLAFLTLLTNSFYIALAKYGSEFLEDYSMMKSCAIGFSGVLFALKVITTAETGPGTAYIMGIPVPSKYAAWAELVAIHLLVPNASFLGHLAGILAGCAYISSPVGRVVDYIITTITGWPMFHETGSDYEHQSYQSSNTFSGSTRNGFDSAGQSRPFGNSGFGTGYGNSGFGTGFGNTGFGTGFGNPGFGSGFGSGFGNGGFGNFGPNLFHRTHTSREQEYGWRY